MTRGCSAPAGGVGSPRAPQLLDNEGRPYDLSRVIVNFNNVGTTFGRRLLKKEMYDQGCHKSFHWEGVRRCVIHLVVDLGMKVVGVIYENWRGYDGAICQPACEVRGVPADIRALCEHVEETPRIDGAHQRSADDEMTIKKAYRRNCRILDNDNYRDWQRCLGNPWVRAWLEHSKAHIFMKYYFDSDLGYFETLDGNAEDKPAEAAVAGAAHAAEEPDAADRWRAWQ